MLCVGKFAGFVKLIGVKPGMFAVGKLTLIIFIGAELGGKCVLEFDLYKLFDIVLGANVEGEFAAYIFEWGKFEGILFVITFAVTKFFAWKFPCGKLTLDMVLTGKVVGIFGAAMFL